MNIFMRIWLIVFLFTNMQGFIIANKSIFMPIHRHDKNQKPSGNILAFECNCRIAGVILNFKLNGLDVTLTPYMRNKITFLTLDYYQKVNTDCLLSKESNIRCCCSLIKLCMVKSSIGRPFRSPLRRRRNMAALPLPAAILDDLIPSFPVPGMRSSKMAGGSGRAAILRLRLNGDRKGRPKSWLTSFPTPPSWIQDGGATSNVWRTS